MLSMIENPTRRRILEALSREPHYPFQLARELRVSQPAIVKHLKVLEEGGLVGSYREDSDRGPAKRLYVPAAEFTVVVDMRSGMFSTRLLEPGAEKERDETHDEEENDKGYRLEEAREKMLRIDERISELEKARNMMLERRNRMISSMLDRLNRNEDNYRQRILLHSLLDRPGDDMDMISRMLDMRLDECQQMFDELRTKVLHQDDDQNDEGN